MLRFKSFYGLFRDDFIPADEQANKWLDEHPEYYVVSWSFMPAANMGHILVIEYTDDEEELSY